jgi:metal-responsive CopG/Arc/MetJ family transcriptional regulator
MPSVLIRLNESLYRALNNATEKRKRAEFIRGAIVRAIREAEEARMRRACELQPDSETVADDWSSAEEFKL